MKERKKKRKSKNAEPIISNFQIELMSFDKIRAIEEYLLWCWDEGWAPESLLVFMEYKRHLINKSSQLDNGKK